MSNPMPPRVDDPERYWTHPPPEPSERCAAWVARVAAGWRGNRRTRMMSYDGAAHYFGVYIWEWCNVLSPMLQEVYDADPK